MILNSKKASFWIFPIDENQKIISDQEIHAASILPKKRSIQYKISRGYIRFVISKLFKIKPLEVPLYSLPNSYPVLGKNFGYVSMSHCYDSLFIGWSKDKIGVDIEKYNTNLLDIKIIKRFFDEKDNLRIKNISNDLLQDELVKILVIKESLIKWQNGNLFNGLKNWEINHKLKVANYKNSKSNVNINNIRFKSWEIGIASSEKLNSDQVKINCNDDMFL